MQRMKKEWNEFCRCTEFRQCTVSSMIHYGGKLGALLILNRLMRKLHYWQESIQEETENNNESG
jgi:hypothetical protein